MKPLSKTRGGVSHTGNEKIIFDKVTISNLKNSNKELKTKESPSSQILANGILD